MADKTVNELTALGAADFSENDLLLVWDSATSTSRKASIDTVATISGTKGGFTFTGGFARRGNPVSYSQTGKWITVIRTTPSSTS